MVWCGSKTTHKHPLIWTTDKIELQDNLCHFTCVSALSIFSFREFSLILMAPLIPVTDRIVDFHFDFNCKLSLPIGYFQLSVVPLTSQIQQLQNLTHMFFFLIQNQFHFLIFLFLLVLLSVAQAWNISVPFTLSLVSPFQLVIKPCWVFFSYFP